MRTPYGVESLPRLLRRRRVRIAVALGGHSLRSPWCAYAACVVGMVNASCQRLGQRARVLCT
eukprot:9495371-Pyramimonas_sp.AAC.1